MRTSIQTPDVVVQLEIRLKRTSEMNSATLSFHILHVSMISSLKIDFHLVILDLEFLRANGVESYGASSKHKFYHPNCQV